MDIKSFAVGMLVALVISITSIASGNFSKERLIIKDCNLVEDNVIDTEFENLMIQNRVQAYERGYYTCLKDTYPDMYDAYLNSSIQLRSVTGDSAFNVIVDAQCAKYNFNAEDKEYLCTLLLD